MSQEINIYAAGLFDGEGSVSLIRPHKTSRFRVPAASMSSTTPELLSFMVENFGGRICSQKKTKEHHSQSYSWRINYNSAISFLENVYPYLREPSKKYRAGLILNEYKHLTIRNGRYNQNQLKSKLEFERRFFNVVSPSRGLKVYQSV